MTSSSKTSKKRAAPSQIGPRSKKTLSEKPHTRDEKSGAAKRTKPVTLVGTHDSEGSSPSSELMSEVGDVESTEGDEEMVDVPMKDPNGGR
jgi:hypothetical protein